MKIVNLLNRVIGNNGRQLKKANEYMYWSPFTSHHKPKLQINIQTQKIAALEDGGGDQALINQKKRKNHYIYPKNSDLFGTAVTAS